MTNSKSQAPNNIQITMNQSQNIGILIFDNCYLFGTWCFRFGAF